MLLAGPACTFNDYIDFIEGRDIARATEQVSGMAPKETIFELASASVWKRVFVRNQS